MSTDTNLPSNEVFKEYLDPKHTSLTCVEMTIVKHLSEHIVVEGRLTAAMEMIQQIIAENEALSEPRHGMLVGDSGCGKTTLLDLLKEQFPPQEEVFRLGVIANIPAVMMSLPTNITPRSMAKQALLALGDQSRLTGTCYELTERLCRHIKDCNVKLFAVDEMQDMLALGKGKRADQSARLREARNWLKTIINKTHTSFIAMGTHETLALIEGDAQLERRFAHLRILDPFDVPSRHDTGMVDFVDELLLVAAGELPFFDNAEFLSKRPADAERLYAATLGVPSRLKDAVTRAALAAYRRQSREITMADFATGFEQRYQSRLMQKASEYRRATRKTLLEALDGRVINPFTAGNDEISQLVMKMAA